MTKVERVADRSRLVETQNDYMYKRVDLLLKTFWSKLE